jgi:hypothetical protein|nr:MAG TPA: hypothetical protein [Caudoviricetes sp.]
MRKVLRFIGFRALAAYAVLEEAYVDKLIKNGYLEGDAKRQNERLQIIRHVLTKLKKEY